MKSFLIKCFLFFVVFFVLEKSLIFLRNRLPERELDKRLESIINGKINADIIVLGSSRGARDIVASQLSDSLHRSAYNLSYPGSNIFFHEYLLTELLKNGNKKPAMVILAVDDPSELEVNSSIKFRLDRLYPLVKYPAIREKLIDEGEKNELLSKLFVIHQLSISNFDLRNKHFKDQDTLQADGSMPISWQSKKFNKKFANRNAVYNIKEEDQSRIKSFTNFVNICRDNHITLVFAFAPNFGTPSIGFTDRIAALAGINSNLLMYDTTNTVYQNADYYFDNAHLKLNGATIFTSEISGFIKKKDLLP